MRQFITILSGAAMAVAAALPLAAQEGAQERRALWIGAMCVPVDPALRSQLRLDEGVGLLVAEVVPESPAAQAGLQRFDVVTGLDGRPVGHVGRLMEAVDAAGDEPLKLDLYRAGKPETIEVTPAERPRGDVLRRFNVPFNEGRNPPQSPEEMREWVDKMRQNLPEGEARRIQEWAERMQQGEAMPFRLHFFGPGVVMHQVDGALPKGVSVTVRKNGDAPAEVHVERGDEKWDVRGDDLDKLPSELRGPVGVMLGGRHAAAIASPGAAAAGVVVSSGEPDVKIEIDGKPVPPGTLPRMTIPLPPTPPNVSVDAEIDALKRQVEQLRRQLNEFQKSLPAVPAKEPATKRKVES